MIVLVLPIMLSVRMQALGSSNPAHSTQGYKGTIAGPHCIGEELTEAYKVIYEFKVRFRLSCCVVGFSQN